MLKKAILLLALAAIVAAIGVWVSAVSRYQEPAAAMAAFLRTEGARAEEQLIDPLILCGEPVVPLVIEHLRSGGQLRPYACVFLGNGQGRAGLPVLLEIVADPAEHQQTRGYALAAIHRIDAREAAKLAESYSHDDSWVGIVSRELLAGEEPSVFSRSYLAAIVRWKL